MKAIRVEQFGEPFVMKMAERPDLTVGPGQVLVDIKAAGVNPVDTYIRSGSYGALPELPYTPGSDAAGVVVQVGADVSTVLPGQRVWLAGSLSGTYAEQALCTPAQVFALPDYLSFSQGAALHIPYTTASYALLEKTQPQDTEIVLVHGASGAVGLACVQLCCCEGIRVWGTAGSAAGRDIVFRQGAERVFDHHAADYTQAIMRDTQGRGVDVIVEMRADINFGADLELLAPNGRVVIIGCRGPAAVNPRLLMQRQATVYGMILSQIAAHEKERLLYGLQQALFRCALIPVVAREFPLAEAAAAHRHILEPGARGKIVLVR